MPTPALDPKITDWINTNRAKVSDDAIRDYLRNDQKMDPALVDQYMHQSKPDTFMGESGLEGLGAVGDALANSGHTINPQDVWNILRGAAQGQWQETKSSVGSAIDAARQGNLGDAALHYMGGFPLVGHPAEHLLRNLGVGGGPVNAGGAAGDALSLFGPRLAEALTEGASGAARTAGQYMYRSRLPFNTSAESLEDIKGAVGQGMQKGYTAQGLFGKGGALERIGAEGQPGTDLEGLRQQIQPYVTGSNGDIKGSMETMMQPFLQRVMPLIDSPVAGGRATAAGMIDQIEPTIQKADPKFASILYNKDPKAGPVLAPDQQARFLQLWAKNNRNGLTVGEMHDVRANAYKTLSASAYSDKASEGAANTKDAAKFLAAGAKNAVAEVHPAVADALEQQHNTLTLKSALSAAAKENPKEFNILTNLAIGATIGGGAHMGGLGMNESMGAGLAGVLAIKAAQSPQIATRLGLILGKRFPQVLDAVRPIVNPAGIAGSAAGQAARSGNDPIQQLFQPKPQQ